MTSGLRRVLDGEGTKRALDVAGAAMGLLILSPLLVVTALLVRLRLGGPVLFRQERPGLHGEPFTLYKFRTLYDRCDDEGQLLPDEQRLGRFGAFLRSTSVDELPQLWNVLRGDMSLVGPRPLLPEYLERYTARQARRHEVRPGITGWAQVLGRNAISWEEKLEADVWYVDHHSLWLDLEILLRTIVKVCTRDGVRQPGRATVERFRPTPGP